MFAHAFRTALRTLRRNRGFAGLNVAGLAVGLACVVLIALYVRDERLVDRFHENADRIVRVDAAFEEEDGMAEPGAYTQGRLAPALEAGMPAVEACANLGDIFRVSLGPAPFDGKGFHLVLQPELFTSRSLISIIGDTYLEWVAAREMAESV